MKIMKLLYFALCFAIILTIFYFFCNSTSSERISRTFEKFSNVPNILVAFSKNSIRDFSRQCAYVSKPEGKYEKKSIVWQELDGNLFFYSAFYDDRAKYKGKVSSYVRVLGMSDGQNSEVLYCRLWYNNTSFVYQTSKEEIWATNWDYANSTQYYRPYIFSCPVPENTGVSKFPDSISMLKSPCEHAQNILPILPPAILTPQRNFVVCLKPLDFREDLSFRLLEWIELQFLLGADKISTYVFHVHPKMLKVLQYYEKLGKVSIHFHTLPGKDPNDPVKRSNFLKNNVWQKRRHEIIPYNDCLYHHAGSHRFLVILDMDEAIIPMMHHTWEELLDHIFSENTQALEVYSSLSASNVYFFSSFGEYTKDPSIPPYMHMLRHIYRSANFSKPGFAVKSFFATNNTLAVFNHYTLIPLYEKLRRNALIGRHLAQMHHYRDTCPPLMEEECETNFMKFYKKDTVIWKYKNKVIERVEHVIKNLRLNKTE